VCLCALYQRCCVTVGQRRSAWEQQNSSTVADRQLEAVGVMKLHGGFC
jgi:hypothetical protein